MKLVILAGSGASTNILGNWLLERGYSDLRVVMEQPVPRLKVLRFRCLKLGAAAAIGQAAFMAIGAPLLRRESQSRYKELLRHHRLSADELPQNIISHVLTVNDPEVIDLLKKEDPKAVIVNGTRIINSSILNCVDAPLLNTHAGITPTYRGVHGGYWALWNRDPQNFGVTLHVVDSGVDTGPVLGHSFLSSDERDNFFTYPLLQQIGSFPLLADALDAIDKGQPLEPLPVSESSSRQWYHPTLLQYVAGRLRGVK